MAATLNQTKNFSRFLQTAIFWEKVAAIRNMKSMSCRGGTAGVELALIAALLPAPSRLMWPQNGVRQAGTTSFVQNQNVARLSHPYGLDHISNC
jgi:hypothetical protein